MDSARCAVMAAPGRIEVVERPIPDPAPDGAVLRVEVCGVCGSDVELFEGDFPGTTFPLTPGHEPVGVVERLGREAGARWGLVEGDRVAMLSTLRCGACEGCARGGSCRAVGPGMPNYGFRPFDGRPGLWGGFATHLSVPPTASFVPMGPEVPTAVASLFNALANGYEWTLSVGAVQPGQRVVVFGPGPRGLACLVAAKEAGATFVGVVGLAADTDRLALATRLGADGVVAVGDEPPADAVSRAFGADADVVIDTSPRALDVPDAAARLVRPGGTVVLAGLKGRDRAAAIPVDLIVDRHISLRGAPSKSLTSTERAVRTLERSVELLRPIASHAFSLDQLEEALAVAAGRPTGDGRRATHVRVEP